MATVAGSIHLRKRLSDGTVQESDIPIDGCYASNFSLKLAKNLHYMVGIDQSTSCTGFYVRECSGRIETLFDVRRGADDTEEFFKNLKFILKSVFEDTIVDLVVHEEPVPNLKQAYSGRILSELKGRLQEWIKEIPAFQNATIKRLYPQSWKKFIMDAKAAKAAGTTVAKRMKSKAAISEDVCKILPYFKAYRDLHYSVDYDAFDACGILVGYLAAAFDSDGNRKIYSIQEKRHSTMMYYKYVKRSEFLEKIPHEVIFGSDYFAYRDCPVLMYNSSYKFIDNVVMAGSEFPISLTTLPDSEVTRLQFSFNFEKNPDYVMAAVICNKGKVSGSILSGLKSRFEMFEEIKGL